MRAETEKTLNQLRKVMDEGDDIRKFIRPQEGIRIYSLSRTFFNEIAKEAGAMYKIGKKVVLVEVEPFEAYIRNHKVAPDSDETIEDEEDEE